jgi:hypothetical protein
VRILIPAVIIGAAYLIFLVIQNRDLKRRIKSVDHPELLLSRRKRRAYAEELLQRQRDQYEETRQQKLTELIRGELDLRKEKQ